jgi:hypothetical protein
MSRASLTRLVLTAGTAALVAFSLAGCAGLSIPVGGATRDDETQEVTEGGTESVFEISVGDCLLEPDGQEVFDVEAVPCAEPHEYEVYHEFEVDLGDEWPGTEAIGTAADEGCHPEFEAFTGIAFEESATLWYTAFTPLEASWAQGDRVVQWIVYEASDDAGMTIVPVEGSLKGAAR